MSPEQQRIKIAEACGWKFHAPPIGGVSISPWEMPHGGYTEHCPDYLKDLNAMHEAEKVLTDEQPGVYDMNLWIILQRDWEAGGNPLAHIAGWHATASQRAEAFLGTLGLWEEKGN